MAVNTYCMPICRLVATGIGNAFAKDEDPIERAKVPDFDARLSRGFAHVGFRFERQVGVATCQ